MATSAFKSTSRRGNLPNSITPTPSTREISDNSPQKIQPRRSRSVSAFSRNPSTVSSDFSVKRDNPLFWSSDSPPENEINYKPEEIASKVCVTSTSDVAESRRGRSGLRNADVSSKSSGSGREIGRSLSRVDTSHRGRSVSRRPTPRGHYVNSESEVEQERSSTTKKYGKRSDLNSVGNGGKKADLVRIDSDMDDQIKNRLTWSSQHPPFDGLDDTALILSCSQVPNWEDAVSTSSFSGAEEITIKAVCEQMKPLQGDHLIDNGTNGGIYETVRSEVRRAISDIQEDLESAIRRRNATSIATANVTDIPPELVNPGAVELILDIRNEYAKKLEQSQERARKLRADLAIEEHRGKELSRILKEILPHPNTPHSQKSRFGRKTSMERRKMSKRLTDEAMTYFDECVSLSTFDSSDFSAPEDPPINVVGITNPIGNRVSLTQASTSSTATYPPKGCLDELDDKQALDIYSQFMHKQDALELIASSGTRNNTFDQASPSSTNAAGGRKFQFSFAQKPTETFELQQDIRNYVKNFEKEIEKDDMNSHVVRSSYYDLDEYSSDASADGLLFDRVLLKNRVESGTLLVCGGGGMEISFSFV